MKFPRIALVVPAFALGLLALVGWALIPHTYNKGNKYMLTPTRSLYIPSNVEFRIGPKPLTVLQRKARGEHVTLSYLEDLLGPEDADATSFGAGGATYTVTPGANINLQLASPQASAAYVACNFALSPTCRVYVNAAISTLALYNGTDGTNYTVELVQDGTGHSIAVPTAGGTPASITTQVAGWGAAQAPIAAAITAPTQQAGAVITWQMIYDSTVGMFVVYSIN